MNTKTLDEKTLRLYPESFTPTECYLCGAIAARWNGSRWNDEACDVCEDYAEREYAAQGGE